VNARYYDATIGRFINVDPIQDGWNWYVYCNNNPLKFVDPSGLLSFQGVSSAADLSLKVKITAYGNDSISYQDKFEIIANALCPYSDYKNALTGTELIFQFLEDCLLTFTSLGSELLGMSWFSSTCECYTFNQIMSKFAHFFVDMSIDEAIDSNLENIRNSINNILTNDPEIMNQFRNAKAEIEQQFINDVFNNKNFNSKYIMDLDENGKLRVDGIINYDKFISELHYFRDKCIDQGKYEYIMVDLPKDYIDNDNYKFKSE